MPKIRWEIWLYLVISLPLYLLIQYSIERSETAELITPFSLLFILYLIIYSSAKNKSIIKLAFLFAILYRVAIVPGMPNLSDDVYRFIWDGNLVKAEIDPFQFTPSEILPTGIAGNDLQLYQRLNSPDYHSVYPPILQGLFFLAVTLTSGSWFGSMVILKLFILLGELFTFSILKKLIGNDEVDQKIILLYALNPLAILELSGNLHFEGLMIPFILFSILMLKKGKHMASGISLGISIGIKLIPAIFIPFFIIKLHWKKAVLWALSMTLFLLLIFISLINSVNGISSGLALYFQKFEFNASIYYLVRQIGFWIKGYNIIGTSGPALGLMSFVFIMSLLFTAYKRKLELALCLQWSLLIYLAFAAIVHPWYVIPLLAISILTGYKFAVLWSFLIFLTYAGYTQYGYNESMYIVFIEYFFTFGLAAWEIWRNYEKRLHPR